ncbi:MAG: hypothetical protein ACRDG4_02730 [Chloroflexota bacterium]
MTTPSSSAGAELATAGLALHVQTDPRLRHALTLLPEGDPLLKGVGARMFPIELNLRDRRLGGDDFRVVDFHAGPRVVIVTCIAGEVELRLTWSIGMMEALCLLVQLRTATPGSILDGTLGLSLLDHLHPGPLDRPPKHDAGIGPLTPSGRPVIRTGKYLLPWWWSSDTAGLAVIDRRAPNVSFPATYQPVTRNLPVRIRNEWMSASELILMPCAPGWLGAFTAWRDQLRAGIDLTAYKRPDFAWYRNQWVQHFTFLYGKEIFDHRRGRLDVDQLLDDGQRFGGYDGILLWPAYPRIGVDERDQFDFYDDLPGWRLGVRELADRARERGTRVFIPYLPWDMIPDSRHGIPAAAPSKLARAVEDMAVDGVFLDTMDSIRSQFRAEIDARRSGVVFCSEGQPGRQIIGEITGSWDQAEHRHIGEVDLMRFLFPEHPSFLINRHATGAHRERVIGRALFNGTGLVVWQDVFGEVLPFTDRQAALTRDTARLLRAYAHCFRGVDALPLVPTTDPAILANGFTARGGSTAVTAYNAGEASIHGDLVAWQPMGSSRYQWRQVSLDEPSEGRQGGGESISGNLAPGELAVFVGVPRDRGTAG